MYILQHLQILVIKKFKDVGVTRKFKELTAWLVKVSQLNVLIHYGTSCEIVRNVVSLCLHDYH